MNKTHLVQASVLQVYAYMWTWQDTASRCMGPCLESIAFVFDELLTSMCAKVFVSRLWATEASERVFPYILAKGQEWNFTDASRYWAQESEDP